MDYQELIEAAHEMTTDDRIKAVLEDGALLDAKFHFWRNMEPEEIINDIESDLDWEEDIKYIKKDIVCAACQQQIISETNPKAQYLDLCDDCFKKLNVDLQSEIIGYRKCE